MSKLIFSEVPVDEAGYPTWEWPDKASQLLFDVGYSYALLRQAETMLEALYISLGEHETAFSDSAALEANRDLCTKLNETLLKMESFRKSRLGIRDEIYAAGYVAGAKLEEENT
jgi:hypothetical protein